MRLIVSLLLTTLHSWQYRRRRKPGTAILREDWDRGLPNLALGADKELQALADTELRGVASADEEVDLGDRWWGLALRREKAPSEVAKKRASYWYKKAHASLTGFVKDRIEQRLESLSPNLPDQSSLVRIRSCSETGKS